MKSTSFLIAATTALILLELALALANSNQTISEQLKKDYGHLGEIHNFYFGIKHPDDRLMYTEEVQYDAKADTELSKYVSYPRPGVKFVGKINYIQVLDNGSDGTGGYVYIRKRSLGTRYTCLLFKSQKGHPISFTVYIYGR